jgi:hypothetical protein
MHVCMYVCVCFRVCERERVVCVPAEPGGKAETDIPHRCVTEEENRAQIQVVIVAVGNEDEVDLRQGVYPERQRRVPPRP